MLFTYLSKKSTRALSVLYYICEFDVVDMPVTVAVDAQGTSVHTTGPAEWSHRIAASQ